MLRDIIFLIIGGFLGSVVGLVVFALLQANHHDGDE